MGVKDEQKRMLEFQHLKIINKILASGDSVMISPSAKNGLRIMQVKKVPVKEDKN